MVVFITNLIVDEHHALWMKCCLHGCKTQESWWTLGRPALAEALERKAMAILEPGVAMAMEEWVYRVCPQEEWASTQATGSLHGGPLDTSSGFIHLSTAAQVAGTLSRFYAGRDDLYLLKINASKLGDGLQYDNVEGVGKFPHFYGSNRTFCPLPLSAVEASAKVKLESDKHILPFEPTDSQH